jgi:exopolyphosphatase/guanosine-5'-triphosphate,3'-diphosphate pyrophosphatase
MNLENDASVGPLPSHQNGRIAVIDIGSNSVRLVVYDKNGVYPAPLFDERVECRLGADLDSTGTLSANKIATTIQTLARFVMLIESMDVGKCYAIATAAVRRARNGEEFCSLASDVLKQPIQVLSQTEEAEYVARGLTLNVPSASGLLADLGGGSIEIVALKKGRIEHHVSFNFGHLSDVDEKDVMSAFESTDWLSSFEAKRLYGVGGSFRAFGSVFFNQTSYPLPVLHGTKITTDFMKSLCDDFSRQKTIFAGVPRSRRTSMPVAAKIVRALLEVTGVKQLVVSGTSIRDGVIVINELNDTQRADFLLAVSQEIAGSRGRFAGVSEALKALMQPLTGLNPEPAFARLVELACNLADICWNEHRDMQGDLAARRIIGLPVNCVTHKERVWLGVALYHRYVGTKQNKPQPKELTALLRKTDKNQSVTIGLALRFALNFSAGTKDYLRDIRFKINANILTLHVSKAAQPLFDESCARRFRAMAESAERTPKVVFD